MSTFDTWLQSRLTSHHFAIPVTGTVDAVTIKALKAFQASRGLEPTGLANEVTVSALRETSSILPKGVTVPDRDTAPAVEKFQPSKNIWPRQADCLKEYGPVGTNQTQIEIPFAMFLAWAPDTKIRKMTLHKRVAPSASKVLGRIAQIYTESERKALGIDQFGGSLNVRKMRGGNSYSMHSWGIAIDFDPLRNALNTHKPKARLSHPDAVDFWVAWESEGWLSLGRERDFDWMHVQAARL